MPPLPRPTTTGCPSSPRPIWSEALEARRLLATVPAGFVDEQIIGNLDSPTAMTIANDGRIFLANQDGKLYIVENGQATLFKTFPEVNFQVERGLLGVALDPGFDSNGLVYVYYTTEAGGSLHNRISRLAANGNTAGAEQILVELPNTGATNHLGGALHFGLDGKLYVGIGDHTNGPAAQELTNVFGKMLRFNPDGSIPTDNPFYNQTTGLNRAIYAFGLRNPFTFAVQPGTGRIYVNDVGAETWEEINDLAAGANYGWPTSEGPVNTGGFTAPIHAYSHATRAAIAIAGGAFYNPDVNNFPAQYVGKYFFADLGGWFVDMYDPATGDVTTNVFRDIVLPVDLDVAPDGSFYYLARGTNFGQGQIGRIRFAQAGAPSISQHPASQAVSAGGSATFSVVASGSGTLEYQWQKNGQNINGANDASFTINGVQPGDAGEYRVVVSNNITSTLSNAATLTVNSTVGTPPVARIITPAAGTTFRYGQTFSFSSSATDAENGNLGPSRFTWRVDYITGDVVRPFVSDQVGTKTGTFTIPTTTPFKETNVRYRIRLTVTDLDGQSTTVTRDLLPVVANLSLRSNIGGVTLELDGIPHDPPFDISNVAGLHRVISAPPQVQNGDGVFLFDRWSDGGEMTHEISAPGVNATYTAFYEPLTPSTTKGLTQTIYNNRNRTGTVVTGNVRNVDFDWGDGKPHPYINGDTFFIRWRGKVQPLFDETYTFYADADDGVRLFVNGQLLVDTWADGASGEQSGSIDLLAGFKYDLRFDYYENLGDAHAKLSWSSASQEKEIIPRNRLFASILPQTLLPTADAFVFGGAPTTNFGQRSTFITKSAAGTRYDREAYFKFDLTQLDSSVSIGQAKLRLYGRLSDMNDPNVVSALYSAPRAKWGETSITYANRPATAGGALATAMVSNTTGQWWEFDLTEFLQAERAAGRTIVTFVLRNLSDTVTYALFHSKEASGNLPQLLIWP